MTLIDGFSSFIDLLSWTVQSEEHLGLFSASSFLYACICTDKHNGRMGSLRFGPGPTRAEGTHVTEWTLQRVRDGQTEGNKEKEGCRSDSGDIVY